MDEVQKQSTKEITVSESKQEVSFYIHNNYLIAMWPSFSKR